MREVRQWSAAASVFVIAVALNYVWELAQSPLYLGQGDLAVLLWHCLRAALGDGLLVLLIWLGGILVVGRPDWFRRPGRAGYAWMLCAGLALSVTIEWFAVHVVGRWAYAPRMPIIPWLEVGLVPVLQMLLLPPLVFSLASLAGRWRTAAERGSLS